MSEEQQNETVGIPIARAPYFNKIYSTRAIVQSTEFDFRVILANEKLLSPDDYQCYVGEAMVILTPISAKELMAELQNEIEKWEEHNGEIPFRGASSKYTRIIVNE